MTTLILIGTPPTVVYSYTYGMVGSSTDRANSTYMCNFRKLFKHIFLTVLIMLYVLIVFNSKYGRMTFTLYDILPKYKFTVFHCEKNTF